MMTSYAGSEDNYFLNGQYLLEFHKILELVGPYAVSDDAKLGITELIHAKLNTHPEEELGLISELSHFISLVRFSLDPYYPIQKDTEILAIENSELSQPALIRIRMLALNVYKLKQLLKRNEIQEHYKLIQCLQSFPDLNYSLKEINEIFDENDIIKDNASSDLLQIRNHLQKIQRIIYTTFKKELENARSKGLLAEGEESIRNGRFVFRVLAEHKRKIPGILVDESDSGKTVFIEPQACVELYNQLVELELKEKREISKILRILTSKLKPFYADYLTSYQLLVLFDISIAKSLFGISIQGILPALTKDKKFIVKDGFHPLLYLNLLKKSKVPKPLNFFLNEKNRILLVSGPNAGGKTVVLKTIGLLQLMLQRGFLIPVSAGSVFPIFKNIWVNIGDLQSLEDGLSTYSAQLKYMKHLVTHVNEDSLVLMDELGSGTEPRIGGAIAESVLIELIKSNSFGIITTHYSNLKALAQNTTGIINGAMLFDEQKLEPKYILEVGKPGSSFALDIAKKLAFPQSLLDYAKKKAGKDIVRMEELISKLEDEKTQLSQKNESYLKKLSDLNKLIRAYESIQKQYELKRLKLKLDSKQLELDHAIKIKQNYHALVEEIKSKLDIIKAKELVELQNSKTKSIVEELNLISEQYSNLLTKDNKLKQIHIGDKVRSEKHNITGVISELANSTATVITENFTFYINKNDLSLVPETILKVNHQNIKLNLVERASKFESTLDLRGLPLMEGTKLLEENLDQMILSNVKEIKIIHGLGTGALKKAIHQVLKRYKFVENYFHPDDLNGGKGITIVKFKE